ncbi:MAG: thiamine ABC transporter substrate binding subunit [Dongiaceae bacterium]
MRYVLMLLTAWLSLTVAPTWAADLPTLTIYTYSSFTSEWGPGPAIKTAFEADCQCQVNYVAVEDGAALLSRLQLEGDHTAADIVLGLDTNLTAEAAGTGLFAPHEMELSNLRMPIAWTDPIFVPFDYGYFAFVYDKARLSDPPTSLDELVNGDPDQKILIQDPRTSTPGLGLMLWMQSVYGDQAGEAWQRLKRRVLTVTKGWSEAYSLFVDGEAPMVLSYTTSPAYHIIAENDDRYAAAAFAEGHYMQIEVAGLVARSANGALAKRFLQFMGSPGFQDQIATGNWMYPVIEPTGGLPPAFGALVQPGKSLLMSPDEVAANRKKWIDSWLDWMSE